MMMISVSSRNAMLSHVRSFSKRFSTEAWSETEDTLKTIRIVCSRVCRKIQQDRAQAISKALPNVF